MRPGELFEPAVTLPLRRGLDQRTRSGSILCLHAVEAYGEPRVELPEGPPFFRFSDPAECVKELIAAGFENPDGGQGSATVALAVGRGSF